VRPRRLRLSLCAASCAASGTACAVAAGAGGAAVHAVACAQEGVLPLRCRGSSCSRCCLCCQAAGVGGSS